jgi:hypothetical protein
LATVLLFVVLLTIIFSFLGAFFCAGLAGMMLGSVTLQRRYIAGFSLIFPTVLFTILRVGGAELLMKQIVLLSFLCWATFWVTYLLVRAVVSYERKSHPAGAPGPFVSPQPAVVNHRPPQQKAAAERQSPRPEAVLAGADHELSLQLLQGKWSCAAADGNSHREQKLMEIDQHKLVLTISDRHGQVHFVGKGEVTLSKSRAFLFLTSSAARHQMVDDTLVSI